MSKYEPIPGVELDTRICFGRPRLKDRGIPTAALASRFRAGDDPPAIAKDYRLDVADVYTALRYEMRSPGTKRRDHEKANPPEEIRAAIAAIKKACRKKREQIKPEDVQRLDRVLRGRLDAANTLVRAGHDLIARIAAVIGYDLEADQDGGAQIDLAVARELARRDKILQEIGRALNLHPSEVLEPRADLPGRVRDLLLRRDGEPFQAIARLAAAFYFGRITGSDLERALREYTPTLEGVRNG